MGSGKSYAQAIRISQQYYANFNEVYDLLKQGYSVADVTKKMKRRWEKMCSNLELVTILLRFYGHGKLSDDAELREVVATKILKAANAGRMNEADRFVMAMLKKTKRRACIEGILLKITTFALAVLMIYITIDGVRQGRIAKKWDISGCVAAILFYVAVFVLSFTKWCALNRFGNITERQRIFKKELRDRIVWKDARTILN